MRIHVLSAVEEQTYFAAARRWNNLYDLGRLMINQGCRPEEILMLESKDVDLERSAITIRSGKTTAARRKLRLTAESRAILAGRLGAGKGSHWLFPSPKRSGKPLTKLNGTHEKALELTRNCKACGKIRLEHLDNQQCRFNGGDDRFEFVIYDFRHTFATRAAEAGMPIATLAAILGHADLRSVMKYVHIRQEAQDRAMAEFEQKILAATGAPTRAVKGSLLQ
jgi:integrase